MSKSTLTDYDPSEYLETPEDIADFMRAAFKSNNRGVIAAAFDVVAIAHRKLKDGERMKNSATEPLSFQLKISNKS